MVIDSSWDYAFIFMTKKVIVIVIIMFDKITRFYIL